MLKLEEEEKIEVEKSIKLELELAKVRVRKKKLWHSNGILAIYVVSSFHRRMWRLWLPPSRSSFSELPWWCTYKYIFHTRHMTFLLTDYLQRLWKILVRKTLHPLQVGQEEEEGEGGGRVGWFRINHESSLSRFWSWWGSWDMKIMKRGRSGGLI